MKKTSKASPIKNPSYALGLGFGLFNGYCYSASHFLSKPLLAPARKKLFTLAQTHVNRSAELA